jgi:uncharacterized delta-60 repeat protein
MRNLFCGILVIGLVLSTGAFAQLDTTFNSTGFQTASFGFHAMASDVAVQPNNKIVVAGQCQPEVFQQCVARYNEDGSLDMTFGEKGFLVNLDLESGGRVALQSDGKILVGGTKRFESFPSYSDTPTLTRYNSDGTLDSSFGGGNVVIAGAGMGIAYPTGLAVQSDGKIVMVGGSYPWSRLGTTASGGWMVRYLPNGTPDTSFGTGGIRNLTMTDQTTCAGLAIQPDGKLLLSVYASTAAGTPPPKSMLWRLNADGTSDPTWGGGDGIVDVPAAPFLNSIKYLNVMLDGRVVAISDFRAIFRFNPDGSLDTSLDGDGVRELTGITAVNTDLTVTASGKIMITGPSPGGSQKFSIYRFQADGAIETGFGNNGVLIVDPIISPSENSFSLSSVFDTQGRLVIGGYLASTPMSFAVVRLLAPPVTSVSVSGRVTGPNGNGASGVTVSTSGASATTNPFGFYTLNNIQTNRTYVFSVRSKTDLAFNKRTVLVDDQISGLDFVGQQVGSRTVQIDEPAPKSPGPVIRKLQ